MVSLFYFCRIRTPDKIWLRRYNPKYRVRGGHGYPSGQGKLRSIFYLDLQRRRHYWLECQLHGTQNPQGHQCKVKFKSHDFFLYALKCTFHCKNVHHLDSPMIKWSMNCFLICKNGIISWEKIIKSSHFDHFHVCQNLPFGKKICILP